MRKTKFKNQTCGSNAVDPASTTSKDWGFIPVSGKGGMTTNSTITEKMFQKELAILKEGSENA
jgi:hypothetical protein